MSKNLTQLVEKLTLSDTDIFHIVRSNVDYKVQYSNLITSAVGLVSKTYAEAQALITALTLVPGRFYSITDKADAGIILQAVSSSAFSIKGIGSYYVPDFQDVGTQTGNMKGVWHSGLSGLTANISIAIYNGLHYKNLTGNVGTAPNGDAVNWVVLAKTSANGYILAEDIIDYDFDNDTVVWREDIYGNKVSQSSISTWQWGEDAVYGNIVTGIQGGVTTINQRGSINGCVFLDCVVTFGNSHVGTVTGSLYNTGPFDELVSTLDSGQSIKGCTFNFIDVTTTLTSSLSYRGITFNFDVQQFTLANGQTANILATTNNALVNQTVAVIATGTINLCGTNLYDGKTIRITSNYGITTVTWGVTSGTATIQNAPTGLDPTGVSFIYSLADDVYYRLS